MKYNNIWLNLPVKDASISRNFYQKIGFTLNNRYGNNETSSSFFIGEHNLVLMLFQQDLFSSFVATDISQLNYSNEVLFSLSAESKTEVDQMVDLVETAGGGIYSSPREAQGWMYGMGFADPDGHKWNLLFMDFEKLNG